MSNAKQPPSEVKKSPMGVRKVARAPPAPIKGGERKIIRIAETDLDGNQRVEHALSHIRGVSWSYAHAIRNLAGMQNKKLADLSEEELNKIKGIMANPQTSGMPTWLLNRRRDLMSGKDMHILASDLVLAGKMDVKFMKTIRTYRGLRHSFNYKVRGQRTRSRGANVRGRVGGTMGVVKKKLAPAAAAGKEERKK